MPHSGGNNRKYCTNIPHNWFRTHYFHFIYKDEIRERNQPEMLGLGIMLTILAVIPVATYYFSKPKFLIRLIDIYEFM